MTQQIKLRHGNNMLDLTAAPYTIGDDFVPPAAFNDDTITMGSSANIFNGGELAGQKYADRVWSFSVKVSGTTRADIQSSIRKVASILQLASSDQPLYLDFRQDANIPVPMWGQFGAPLTFEIISAKIAEIWSAYGIENTRDDVVFITLEVTIKPFAIGQKQIMAIATGGIFEETFGRVDGLSSGVVIPPAATNLFTNPIFGFSTYDTLWTAGSLLTVTQDQDRNFLLPTSVNNAFITSAGTTANTYTQSLLLGSGTVHTISAIVKLPDSGSVSSTQLQIAYGGTAQTTTYASLGNGFYCAAGTVSGTGGSLATGVVIKSGYGVHLCAMQAENTSYLTPLAHGDLLGCSWAGTAHISTTTRAAASCKLPLNADTLTIPAGSVRCVVRFDVPNTHANYMFFLDTRDGSHDSLSAFFNPTDDKFYLGYGATLIASAAKTFLSGTTYVLHFVWSSGSMKIYVNGAADGSGSTFAYVAPASNFFIGSDYGGNNQIVGEINGFATFDHALTVAEVTADYAALLPIVARGDRVESVPWFWTDDGDGVLSLDTGKQPLGVAGGVAGNVPAVTELYGTLTDTWTNIYSIALSNHANDIAVPFRKFFIDQSGTATAGDYGGQHSTDSISGTTPTPAGTAFVDLQNDFVRYYGDVELAVYARLKSNVATTGYVFTRYYNGSYLHSDPNTVTFGTVYQGYISKTLGVSIDTSLEVSSRHLSRVSLAAGAGTAITASVDYVAILPRPVAILEYTGALAVKSFGLRDRDAFTIDSSSLRNDQIAYRGDTLDFKPDQYNHLQMYFCPTGTVNPITTYAGTITSIYVTPRWSIL